MNRYPSNRRSWIRRHKFMSALITAGVLLVALAVVPRVLAASAPRDYRDPVQLAQALKDAHHGTAASCGKLPDGNYFCDVANADGASGTYTVHVTADGSGYQAN